MLYVQSYVTGVSQGSFAAQPKGLAQRNVSGLGP